MLRPSCSRWGTATLGALLVLLVGGCAAVSPSRAPSAQDGLVVETVLTGLEVPWALAWAPDGRLFFTERPGRVRVVQDGQLAAAPVATLPVSRATSEGGLLGLALAPDFAASGALYVYYTYDAADGVRNRVALLRLNGGQATEERVILDAIPGSGVHDGGALAFGPDGKLYVGTGDARNGAAAQDLASLSGKVLRLNPDGSIPDDNPFPGSPVYAFGLRNVQHFAWHPRTGQLYASEHGPTGEQGRCCHDEINLILPGGNYGWPEVAGAGGAPEYLDPVTESGSGNRPPGGLAFGPPGPAAEQLFLATLRGGQLWRFTLSADGASTVAEEQLIFGEYGRLRALARGPDGALYLATSNRDGRGRPEAGDDRLLRLTLP
ncbi:MAG: PQQ-dependent sugar dehydrogenase [Chloroflexi bacterium]|nr:PQQ-dependent sugar dehydrogenase [Chloroflexota bacterium]